MRIYLVLFFNFIFSNKFCKLNIDNRFANDIQLSVTDVTYLLLERRSGRTVLSESIFSSQIQQLSALGPAAVLMS